MASASPSGLSWTLKSIAEATRSRFIDATGQPFVTLDSPEVREARCANELLLEAVKKNSLPVAELFVMSADSSRKTVKIGRNLNGEWFTLMRLGEHVEIGNDVNLLGHGFIELHDKVELGDGVTIDTIGHPNDPDLRHTAFTGTVIVQEGAKIGAGTVIVVRAGETLVIGKNAKIANDSIVVKSVNEDATFGGVPAKAIEGAVLSMERKEFRPEGYEEINTLEEVRELFGVEADIKLPIFIKGDRNRLKVEGKGRIDINREAMFDLQGDLTIQPPFQMASRASVQVLPGASAELSPGSFLYTACKLVAKNGNLRIGENAIVAAGASIDRTVDDGMIVKGKNEVLGHVTDKTYDPVPDEWKDRNSLQPKVDAFREYKSSKAVAMSFEDIKQFAKEATRDLFKYRTRPFDRKSLFLKEEFSKLEKES